MAQVVIDVGRKEQVFGIFATLAVAYEGYALLRYKADDVLLGQSLQLLVDDRF